VRPTITIDPGFGGTGWAFWPDLDFDMVPEATGVCRTKAADAGLHWGTRAFIISEQIAEVLRDVGALAPKPGAFYLELPQVFSGSAVSHAAATKGDLFTLAALCGILAREAWGFGWTPVFMSPVEWKGQLNKKALGLRIARVITDRIYRNHEADAVGMGLYLAGRL